MNKQAKKILIIDDDADVLHSARMFLKLYFDTVDTEQNPVRINQLVSTHGYDVVLLDMNFKRGEHDGKEGLYWLERILTIDPNLAVILITAYGDIELAVDAMRQGAFNFVLKPWRNSKLLEAIEAALASRQRSKKTTSSTKNEVRVAENENKIIGNSAGMRQVYALIEKVAATSANVLILGESGTGKDLVAKTLHHQSHRKHAPFIQVDVGALTPTLFESELFGHVRGAFTDAVQDKPGKFEIAHGGTLFLDEIGNLSLPQQAKLLTALQTWKITRVGGNKEIPLDIRLICATNMPLYEMTEEAVEGKFRQDLLYRINTVEIMVPPLRNRPDDVPLLANHFLQLYADKYKKPKLSINGKAMNKLRQYNWPGNIRELRHVVERAVILGNNSTLDAEDFVLDSQNSFITLSEKKELLTLDENEKNHIKKVLELNQGNVTKTAQELGITRTALYRRLDKFNL